MKFSNIYGQDCAISTKKILYKLHYQMITFGKVFCTRKNPNCEACPFKGECKYYASRMASKPALTCKEDNNTRKNPFSIGKIAPHRFLLPSASSKSSLQLLSSYHTDSKGREPIVEMPSSPDELESIELEVPDIEDLFKDVDEGNDGILEINLNKTEEFKHVPRDYFDEILEINLKTEEFKHAPRDYFDEINIQVPGKASRELVTLSPEAASIPLPKQRLLARLRTEHQVYELPDSHPLLENLDRRDEKDSLPYLLATWTRDQTMDTSEKACSSAQNVPDDNNSTIPGTLLIPSRTAMRGSFALNGTYFQVNEVFADDETSEHPINVPREWLWNLPRRTLYCGFGTSSIFRGLTWRQIQRCCCEGFICVRGFNRQTRGPKLLSSRFHDRPHAKGKTQQYGEDED